MLRNQMVDPEGSGANTGGWMADDQSWYTADSQVGKQNAVVATGLLC